MQCDFNTKTMLLGSLSVETIAHLSWRRDMCLATFGSLKIDVERVLIDPTEVFFAEIATFLPVLCDKMFSTKCYDLCCKSNSMISL